MANGAGPQPRLCHVIKVDSFDGYGFNLLAEQGRPGQYIGKVDKGSPAETAGLKQGDKILEVNGVSITNDNHKQVVQKIKTVQGETKLLVVTPSPEDRVPNPEKTKKAQDKKSSQQEDKLPDKKPDSPIEDGRNHNIFTPKVPEITKLNLTMTAAEMRAQLAAKKKVDPKSAKLDVKSKFEIVKQL